MSPSDSRDYALIDRLAEEFAERLRTGERPSLQEYCDQYPGIADDLRAMLPALAEVEQVKDDGQPPAAVLVAEAPARLGEYRILREVGRGGMGVVYEAIQESLGRHVALKVLPAGTGGRGHALERFKREARAAAHLHHTNIVPVFAVGEADGTHYYAMQFIPGQGLDAVLDELRRLRDEPLSSGRDPRTITLAVNLASGRFPAPAAEPMAPTQNGPARSGSTVLSGSSDLSGRSDAVYFRTVARLGAQVADALAYAHGQGVIHRDVKPSNLLLDAHGTLWVTDFGLAQVDGAGDLTTPGDVVGTVRYMAPERFAGKTDVRSDVYGLGLTLYELLTLRPAYDDPDRMKLIDRVRTEDPPRPRAIDPRIPRDLELIIRKAAARDPADRYPTAKELAADLGRYLRDEPVRARRSTLVLRARKWARRNRTVVTAGSAGLALALVAGLIGTAIGLWRANQALDEKNEALKREQQITYFRRVALAHRELEGDSVGRADQLLDECPKELRGWEWDYLKRLRTGELAPLKMDGPIRDVALNDDGSLVAVPCPDHLIRIWDTATGKCRSLLSDHTEAVFCVAFSRDRRLLATGTAVQLPRVLPLPFPGVFPGSVARPLFLGEIKIWDVRTGRPLRTIRGHSAPVHKLAFGRDGRLASACRDGTVKVWDADSGKEIYTLHGSSKTMPGVTFSGDGRFLATIGVDRSVTVWESETGREIRTLAGHRDETTGVSLSPNGQRLATAGYDSTVRVWNVATGDEVFKDPLIHPAPTLGVAFSPDGQRIASAGWDRSVRIWDATTGQEILSLRGHKSYVSVVAFSGDGRVLASAGDEELRVWDARPVGPRLSKEILTLPQGDHVCALAYSPDGRTLAASGPYGAVTVWESVGGRKLHTLVGHTGLVWGVAYSPDNVHLASASYDRTVVIWNVKTGESVRTLQHKGHVWSVAYSPDGKRLVTADDGGSGLTAWDATTGRELFTFRGSGAIVVNSVAFSADGERVVSGGTDGNVRIWDANTGRELPISPVLDHDDFVRGVAYSRDRRFIASASFDETVKVWDAKSSEVHCILRGHKERVFGVAFSPDGRFLASASLDATVKVWDVETHQEIRTFRGHSGMVWCVAFNPDGTRLAVGSGHYGKGEVRIWDVTALDDVPAQGPAPPKK